jgi:hypothetical protein
MSNDGVLYFAAGRRHPEHLFVSIYSLLQHWSGSVAVVVADDDAYAYCRHLEQLDQVSLVRDSFSHLPAGGHGRTYLCKTWLYKLSPFDRTIFLDADTLVEGDVSLVLPGMDEIVLTQWMRGWHSLGNMMSGRIRQWEDVEPELVRRQLSASWPAINTGVFGFSKCCEDTMARWHEVTKKKVQFICDEVAMQLIFPEHPHRLLDDRFNASPAYEEQWRLHHYPAERVEQLDRFVVQHDGRMVAVIPKPVLSRMIMVSDSENANTHRRLPGEYFDVRVWHGHGMKFIKKAFGRGVWWPYYRRAIDANFCSIADWTPWNGQLRGAKRLPRCKLVGYLANPEHNDWQ